IEMVAADLPVITSDVGVASELERRGVRYLAKFRSPLELAAALGELPARLARWQAQPPRNRERLEAVYRGNRAAYADYVGRTCGSAASTPSKGAPSRSIDVIARANASLDGSIERALEHARREGVTATVSGGDGDLVLIVDERTVAEPGLLAAHL